MDLMIPKAMAKSPPRTSSQNLSSSGKRRNPLCWSNIPLDLMRLVFERLGFADFERAKSVCSSWLPASRQSQPNNTIPWLILFPKNNNHVLLFNPEEEDKVYKTQDLGNDFANNFCVATYRSWLLMLDPQDPYWYKVNVYILHLLTHERINLPSLELENNFQSMVFWIDEKAKDYLILKMRNEETVISHKKGDSSWKVIPQLSRSVECCMVYKDHKLYCLNGAKLKVFDLSGDIPQKIFKISTDGYVQTYLSCGIGRPPPGFVWTRWKSNIVVSVSGDILLVTSIRWSGSKTWNFEIYKVDSSKGSNKWEKIVSLEDEAILLGLGITVLAKDIQGLKRNSIYFHATDFENQHDENDVFIYNLSTKKVEQPHQSVSSSVPCSNARWFLPSFKRYD